MVVRSSLLRLVSGVVSLRRVRVSLVPPLPLLDTLCVSECLCVSAQWCKLKHSPTYKNQNTYTPTVTYLGREVERILELYSLKYRLNNSVRSTRAGPVERETHWTRHFL